MPSVTRSLLRLLCCDPQLSVSYAMSFFHYSLLTTDHLVILNTSQYGSLEANVMLGIDEMRNILKVWRTS